MREIDYMLDSSIGYWQVLVDDGTTERDWRPCNITDVPVEKLLETWECLVIELSSKEVKLAGLKEVYNGKEFDIVYQSDIDFRALYGSTSEKVRKQHASDVLSELNDEINGLELSIAWIKSYVPLLREVIRSKQE